MANSQEIFENISELYSQFEAEHIGTTKAAKSRARKAIGEIKELKNFDMKVTAKVMENIIGQINDDPDNIQNGLYIIGFIWLSIGVIMYIYDNILVDLIPKIEKMTRR